LAGCKFVYVNKKDSDTLVQIFILTLSPPIVTLVIPGTARQGRPTREGRFYCAEALGLTVNKVSRLLRILKQQAGPGGRRLFAATTKV
jgi:hypothetical protein